MVTKLLLPEEIIFSSYSYRELSQIVKKFGKKVLLVTGRKAFLESFWGREILDSLKRNKIDFLLFSKVVPEPEIELVEKGLKMARRNEVDLVLGIGGGSVLDVGKAIAGLFEENFEMISEYLYGREIRKRGLPYLAVPTTSGSGSEVTRNAVLRDEKGKIKASIRADTLLPKLAIVDPVLTLTLPREQTLYSTLDAMTHALESFVSKGSNSFTQALSIQAVRLIYQNLSHCLGNPGELKFRENLSFASLLAGIAFSNAGLGLAHALSHPMGALFHLPHGLVNAILIPQVVKFNFQVAGSGYRRLVREIFSKRKFNLELYNILRNFNRKFGLPEKFSELGIQLDKKIEDDIIARLRYSGSLRYNPREVGEEELRQFLRKIW